MNWIIRDLLTGKLFLAVTISLLFSVGQLSAANYYWVGGGANNNFSTAANWRVSSCAGAVSGAVPGAGDNVFFTCSSSIDCDIVSNINIGNITIDGNYTGTVTQAGGTITCTSITQTGGTFAGGSSSITVYGNVIISGGTFTSTSGTLTVNGETWNTTGGTFNHNNGTVTMVDNTNCLVSDTVHGDPIFWNFTIGANGLPSCGYTYCVSNITVLGDFSIFGGSSFYINCDTIHAKGCIVLNNTGSGGGTGSGVISIDGPGNHCIYGPVGRECGTGMIGNVIVDLASTDTLFVYRNPTITSSYTYVGGEIVTIGTLCFYGDIYMHGPSHKISDCDFQKKSIILDSGLNITSDSTLTISGYNPTFIGGQLTATGDLIAKCFAGPGGGTTPLWINGSGTQTMYCNAPLGAGFWPEVFIQKSAGDSLIFTRSLTPYHPLFTTYTALTKYAGTNSDWTYLSGITNAGDGIICFGGEKPGTGYVTSVTGTHTLPNVAYYARNTSITYSYSINTGDILTVRDTFFTEGISRINLTSGEIYAHGPLIINNTGVLADGDLNITINGTGDQPFDGNIQRSRSRLPNIIVDKSSGTLSLIDTITVSGNWQYNNGTVDATSNYSDVVFATSGQTIDGEDAGGVEMEFHDVDLADNNTRTLTGNIAVYNRLRLNTGKIHLDHNTIILENSATNAISRTTGYVISEDSIAPYGTIQWDIDNMGSGSNYEYPFGTSLGNYIPFNFNVSSAGSATGSIDVGTYQTNWLPIPNNRPLPTTPNLVTNLNNVINIDNYSRELDRFWVVSPLTYSTNPTATLSFTYQDDEWQNASNNIIESTLEVHRWLTGSSAWQIPTVGSSTQNTAANTVSIPNQSDFTVFTLVDPNPPDLLISSSDSTLCVGDVINFFDENLVTPNSDAWQFPGATPSTSNVINPTGIQYSAAGTYDVILTANFSGGTVVDTFFDFITVTSAPTIVSIDSTQILCYGDSNGVIRVTASGGSGDYNYEWSDSSQTLNTAATMDSITGLAPGCYTVTVTDANSGCFDTIMACVSDPTPLTYTKDSTNVSCFGASDGTATVTPSGGTGSYSYSWSAGSPGNTATVTGLSSGPVTATITDANGCSTQAVFNIDQPSAGITVNLTKTDATCADTCNGTITATPSGGTPPYTYTWGPGAINTGATDSIAIDLCDGLYGVTVNDANGCSNSASINVGEPTALVLVMDSSSESCGGYGDGSVWATVTGGAGGYTYSWAPGSPTTGASDDTIIGLSVGTYCVTVSDANGCSISACAQVTAPPAIISSSDADSVACFGDATGRAWVTASGGTGALSYAWGPGSPTPGASDDTIINLTAGTYFVTTTDANGCSVIDSIDVGQPGAALSLTITQDSVSCNGGNDGSATVTATGGTGPYTYSWSNTSNSNPATGLSAGFIAVTVTDSRGCIDSASITVLEPAVLVATGSVTSNFSGAEISCNGASDGEATATSTGGTAPYTYAWSTGTPQNGPSFDQVTGLAAGQVIVTVTDNNGCTDVDTFTISEPTAVSLTMDSTNESCGGYCDGSAWVTATGGTGGYNYNWSGGTAGLTNDTIVALCTGTYTVTVIDANNCSATLSVTITSPPAIVTTTGADSVNCFGTATGCAWVVASGGTPGFTYLWSTTATTDTICNLTAGTYFVTTTDNNGCSVVDSVEVFEPADINVLVTGIDVTCNGAGNGIAYATVTGGTPPYTNYLWSAGTPTGANGDTTTLLGPGLVQVTVTDANGCTKIGATTISEPTAITVTATVESNYNGEDISCNGAADGLVVASATGGVGGFTYQWTLGGVGTPLNAPVNDSITDLPAGTYQVVAIDSNGCTDTTTVTLTEPTAISLTMDSINESCSGTCDGSAWITATGGTGSYTYTWSGGTAGVTNDTIVALCAGTYTVTVTDANGCSDTLSVNITSPPAIITTIAADSVACFGDSTACAWVTASGGTPGFTYLWSTGGTTDTVCSLPAGTYFVTTTDNNGCSVIDSVEVGQPGAALAVILDSDSVSCNGDSDGSAWATVTGGTPPYSYSWGGGTPGVSPDTTTGLPAGTVAVTVTDSRGCTITDSITIGEPTALTLVPDSMNISCGGGSDGWVTVGVTGGTSPYGYSWNNGATTDSVFGLPVGCYTVLVTDAHGCQDSVTICLTEPTPIVLVGDSTDVLCNGDSTGTATVTPSGGAGGFTYAWPSGVTTGATDSIAINLAAGTYQVTVTDANSCTATLDITVNEPAAIAINIDTVVNVFCKGGRNAYVVVSATGGTGAYTYTWSANVDSVLAARPDSAYSLMAGNYTVTVSDGVGCSDSLTITITEPALPLTATGGSNNLQCFGDTNGIGWIVPNGGTPPYSYTWAPAGVTLVPTGDTAINLAGGINYSVIVEDSLGCLTFGSFFLFQPTQLVSSMDSVDVSCFGDSTGSATVIVSGGTAPYSYNWSPTGHTGSTDSIYTDLPADTYIVTVVDDSTCTIMDTIVVNEPTDLVVDLDSIDVLCFGDSTGVVIANVSGGVTPYTYSWNTADTANLPAGTYTLTLTDANGCSETASILVNEPTVIQLTTTQQNVACFGDSTGSAGVQAFGGTPGYSYNWGAGIATATGRPDSAINLAAGNYVVTVTDTNGCSDTTSVTITQPATPVTSTMDFDSVSCFGSVDGKAWVTASGGDSVYTYTWGPGTPTVIGAGDTIVGLAAGDYYVTVTDNGVCTYLDTVTVLEPAAITLVTDSINVLCNGDSTGQAWVTVSGGTPNYSYSWSNGSVTDTAFSLPSGAATVTVTDANGCTATATVNITEPLAITLAMDTLPVACNGDSTGKAWVTATGGVGGFTYLWSNGAATDTAFNLPAGTYTVTVTDANGCTAVDSIPVTEPPALVLTTDSLNVACSGDSTGIAWVIVSGGTPGYIFSWSNGSTIDTAFNLPAGCVTVTVTDGNGCTEIATICITEPLPVTVAMDSLNIACFGDSTGMAMALPSGGTPPYTFDWGSGINTNATGDTAINLAAGSYTVTVTDSLGCTGTGTVSVTEPTDILLNIGETDVTCFGDTNGVAWVTAIGGTPTVPNNTGYNYSWSRGTPFSADGDSVSGLAAGLITVTVTDGNGCNDTITTVIGQPDQIVVVLDSTNVNCFGGSDGTAWPASITGGNGGYVIDWGGLTTNGDTAINLAAGSYTISVTDSLGCPTVGPATATVTITGPQAPLTLSMDSVNVLCFGDSNGRASVEVLGGTPGYSYQWFLLGNPVGGNNDTIYNLIAGMYTVVVTDTNGCTATDSVNVTEPNQLTLSLDSINISCFGGNDGKAWVTATGGTAGYNYQWSAGTGSGFGDTIVLLTAGQYCVTVTDANGCSADTCVTIEEPTDIVLTTDSVNVLCNGDSTGVARVTATGGTPGYTYAWPNGSVADSAINLPAGSYTVTVTDTNGCTKNATVNITEPPALTFTLDSVNVTCFGFGNGMAWVVATGGAAGAGGVPSDYNYAWSGGTPNTVGDSVFSLVPGTYTVTVSDANGCSETASFTISEPSTALTIALDSSDVNCFGGSDGVAWVVASGGTPAYSYSWTGGNLSGVQNNDTVFNLVAGRYFVVVTDTNGCTAIDSIDVNEPAAPLSIVKDSLNVACNGDSTGMAWITVSGGTPGYSYAWSGGTLGASDDTIVNLSAGVYRVTVTDTNGCTITAVFNIAETDPLVATIVPTNVLCFGDSTGVATISMTGGTPPYSYSWTPATFNGPNTDTYSGLPAGTYLVDITDSLGCTTSDSVTITEPATPLTTAMDTSAVLCFGGNTGRAWVTASGGTPGYTYSWSGGLPIGAGDTIINLAVGCYTVTVTDNNGCTVVDSICVTQPAAPLSDTLIAGDVSCYGAGDGIAWVTVSGGTPSATGPAGYTYQWSGGTPVGAGDTVRNLTPNNYIVTVTDANGCTITDAIAVFQPDSLTVTLVVDSNSNCYGGETGGLTASFTGGTPPFDISYSGGTTAIATITDTTATTVSEADLGVGTYTVTITDSNGCTATASATIVERPGPQFGSVDVVATLCNQPNGSITLTFTTSDPPLTYVWSHDAALTGPTATGLTDDTYVVTISDASACDTVMSIIVPAIDKPELDTLIIKPSYCGNDDGAATVVLTGGVQPYSYTWSDSTQTGATASGLAPGTYSVTAQDANGCDTILTFGITETAAPEITVDPLPAQTIHRGQTLPIEVSLVSPIDSASIEWTTATDILQGLDCTDCFTPNASPEISTTYIVIVTDDETGCQDTLYYSIVVLDQKNIFIPNAITPNGDGINDVWNITDLEIFPDNEVIIINRWGDEVFREAPYQNGWGGTNDGKDLPAGTYYYIIKLNDTGETVSGPITIIR